MDSDKLKIQQFQVDFEDTDDKIEAVCVESGRDLIVVIGGGTHYHCGTVALTISMPSIKDAQKPTNSTYQIPVPGHKEEALAREGSLILSRSLNRNVVMSVGIHVDQISKDLIQEYVVRFYHLVDMICEAYREEN